jgi:catechol 2,3-dioxygenase-like lactoylglutathione lyase family enzyme
MPQLRHVAITTHDVEKTAKFSIDVFEMKEMGKINDSGTTGCFLSDGVMNLATLHFRTIRRRVSSVAPASRGSTT